VGGVADEPKVTIDDPRYVKALAHPLRIRVLAMLQERPASPVMLAHQLDASLGRVAHHVRVLHGLDMIELVQTRRRRGATEHIYRARELPRFSDEAWAGLGASGRQRVLAAMLEQIGDYVSGSAAAGGFERADANISRVPLRLDEQGWRSLVAAGRRWLTEVDEIQQAARARVADPSELDDVGVVLLVFEALAFSERDAHRRARVTPRTSASRAGTPGRP
jgi:DNA-binding transcriptional ArsR family regulator